MYKEKGVERKVGHKGHLTKSLDDVLRSSLKEK
jgi:hypothetical protein